MYYSNINLMFYRETRLTILYSLLKKTDSNSVFLNFACFMINTETFSPLRMFKQKDILYSTIGNYESYHFYQSGGVINFIWKDASDIVLTKLNNDLSINKTSILSTNSYFPYSYSLASSYSYYNYINNVLYIGLYKF